MHDPERSEELINGGPGVQNTVVRTLQKKAEKAARDARMSPWVRRIHKPAGQFEKNPEPIANLQRFPSF